MIKLAVAAVIALAAAGPAKLVIFQGSTVVAITDYPSMARCEVAKASLESQARAKAEHDLPGYKLLALGFTAYCIPG